jgi:preprotein translocase subunit SecE
MARQTRQQRRERRQAQADSAERRAAARPRVAPVAAPPPEEAQRRGGFWPVRFTRESIAELRKVDWPGQQQLIQGTVVVLVACLIVGVYLWGNDRLWSYVVKHLITG